MVPWHAWLETRARRQQTVFFQKLTAAVRGLQETTAASLAVVVRPASGQYLDVALLFGSVVSWLGLTAILLLPHPIHVYMVPVDVVLLFGLGAWLCAITHLRAWLTPRRRQRRQVKTAAHAAFFEEGTHHAPDDRGVLVYWSRLERRVEVLAGPAVLRPIPMKEWNAAVFALRGAVRQGDARAAFLAALQPIGQLLARHFPPDAARNHQHVAVGGSK